MIGPLRRWLGIVGLAGARVRHRARYRHTWIAVAGVAIPVALALVVAGVGAGLAADAGAGDAEYVIEPGGGDRSAVFDVDGPRLGEVHDAGAHVERHEDVRAATPVLRHVAPVEAGDRREFVLLLGVVPRAGHDDLVGLSTAAMSPGDPHHGGGAATGELVLSEPAADRLERDAGATVRIADRAFTVVDVAEADAGGPGGILATGVPVGVVQLSELQAITGADATDGADRLVVRADRSDAVESHLAGVYPEATVSTGDDVAGRLAGDDLALAMSLAAAVVAVVVGTLFVATALGMVAADDRRHLAALAAIGVARRSRAAIVVVQTLAIVAVGGVAGIAGGALAGAAINAVASRALSLPAIVRVDPALWPYGFVAAVLAGCLAAPYLVFASLRAPVREVVRA